MQHQSQGLNNGPRAGTTGIIASNVVISSAEIQHHIAEGKRLQAEAIAAFLRGCFRLVGGAFQRPSAAAADSAVPHRA